MTTGASSVKSFNCCVEGRVCVSIRSHAVCFVHGSYEDWTFGSQALHSFCRHESPTVHTIKHHSIALAPLHLAVKLGGLHMGVGQNRNELFTSPCASAIGRLTVHRTSPSFRVMASHRLRCITDQIGNAARHSAPQTSVRLKNSMYRKSGNSFDVSRRRDEHSQEAAR